MVRSTVAAVRLDAVAAAKKLHRDLDLRQRVTENSGVIDVFSVISELDIPLVFKRLNSALGLCLPAPLQGIMLTTERGLHIQRFTGAHELGHVILEHRGSIDREILYRGPLTPVGGRDLQEVAADAFAAEFLLPRWLYRHHIRAQGWTIAGHLRNPEIVYQLSLRMGSSYEAACWGLLSHQILPQNEVNALLKTKVGKLKTSLGGEFRPGNSWADVWRLTSCDDGAQLTGNPDDLLRIELNEAAASGHQWAIGVLQEAGFVILSDESVFSRDPLYYGAPTVRTLIARPPENGVANVTLREVLPWIGNDPDDPTFKLLLDLQGRELGGLSRADRHRRGL